MPSKATRTQCSSKAASRWTVERCQALLARAGTSRVWTRDEIKQLLEILIPLAQHELSRL